MKCTFVSTLPFPMTEDKPGLIPSHYLIEGVQQPGDFTITHIDDGYHNFIVPLSDEKAPPIKMIDTGEKICEGLITDYLGAQLAISTEKRQDGFTAIPGIFFVEGVFSKDVIKAIHRDKLRIALGNTAAWFERLVKLADDDWARYHQHKTISDVQRDACNYLGIRREWNFEVQDVLNNLCPACKSSIHPEAIICAVCKTVLNVEEFKKLQIAS